MSQEHSRRWLLGTAAAVGGAAVLAACGRKDDGEPAVPEPATRPRDIIGEAWIYAYPMLMHYKTLTTQVLASKDPGAVGFGKFRHHARFFTPANRDVVTPNNDTPYSWGWLDLRGEPWVLTVPEAPAGRYYAHQLLDLFTQIIGYVGVRATGSGPGNYLIAGPGWRGPTPPGISQVFRSESDIVMDLGRTSLAGPADIPALKAFQARYELRPLSDFAGTSPPAVPPPIRWPVWDEKRALGVGFIGYLNFLLQFAQPPDPSEADLMNRFGGVGIGPGEVYDFESLTPERKAEVEGGVQDAQAALKAKIAETTSSIGLFGSRAQLKNDYMKRAVAAAMGIYGNAAEEAVYVGSDRDSVGAPLDGGARYEIHLAKDQLPPARYFWSATMYGLPDRQLVDNPVRRYSLGDRSPGLTFGADGSLTIYVQKDSPGADKEANWLPSPPAGPFNIVFRLYGPGEAAQAGEWPAPAIRKVA